MKFSATPYTLNLRRARHLHVVLFGAFVYCYVAHLQVERLLVLLQSDALPEWILGLSAALFAMLALVIVRQFCHLPKSWNAERRLVLFIILAFLFGLLTSPTESDTLELKMARLNRLGRYDETLAVSRSFAHPTNAIISHRVDAMRATGTLNDDFFSYPGRYADYSPAPCDTVLGYLLNRNLPALARHLKSKNPRQLQRYEREALVLYNRLCSSPVYVYHDANTEANYSDFKAFESKQKHYSLIEKTNIIADTYGDTYWYYYFYGKY